MGCIQRNVKMNEQLSRSIEMYNASAIKVHEDSRSKFVRVLNNNGSPRKSWRSKSATKKKRRK